jgi:hypothetical protein
MRREVHVAVGKLLPGVLADQRKVLIDNQRPLSQLRCTSCAELWAEPVEYYRHIDHPKGKCTATLAGPPVRLLIHEAVETMLEARSDLLSIVPRQQNLEASLMTAGAVARLSQTISLLQSYARKCEPIDAQQDSDSREQEVRREIDAWHAREQEVKWESERKTVQAIGSWLRNGAGEKRSLDTVAFKESVLPLYQDLAKAIERGDWEKEKL